MFYLKSYIINTIFIIILLSFNFGNKVLQMFLNYAKLLQIKVFKQENDILNNTKINVKSRQYIKPI